MELKPLINILDEKLNQTFTLEDNGHYTLDDKTHSYKIFRLNDSIIFQGSIGHSLNPQDINHSTLLSNLLQFNLKRMQFLDETLFLDPSSQQLYLEKRVTTNAITEQNVWDYFDDFMLNIEVIEDRFFPKSTLKD